MTERSATGSPGSTVKVKICGVMRPEDARAAAAAGADYVGTILSAGFSRSVAAEDAATFLAAARDEIGAGRGGPRGPVLVAVLVDADLGEAVDVARRSGAGVLQLHGEEPPERLRELRTAGDWTLWKALRVRSAGDVGRALERYADVADALLLDGWHGGRGGGAGVRFPWEVVEPMREAFPASLGFVAAGGLEPGNVEAAVRRLAPDVVDVSSGVESGVGRKDPARIRAFVRNARAAGGS